ncbi:MAG: transglycosylase SLT domain-containing protein [Verrucomicrobiota bacterium]
MTDLRKEKKAELILSIVAVVAFALFFWIAQPATYSAPEDKAALWLDIRQAAEKADLKAEFVLAICMAESSLNPNADSGYARGLMQVSRIAWDEVSELPYHEAYEPKTNLEVGTAYLNHLKDFLKANDNFSYANLAASYRFGPYALKDAGYDLKNLQKPANKIYQQLFAGNTAPVPIPVAE